MSNDAISSVHFPVEKTEQSARFHHRLCELGISCSLVMDGYEGVTIAAPISHQAMKEHLQACGLIRAGITSGPGPDPFEFSPEFYDLWCFVFHHYRPHQEPPTKDQLQNLLRVCRLPVADLYELYEWDPEAKTIRPDLPTLTVRYKSQQVQLAGEPPIGQNPQCPENRE